MKKVYVLFSILSTFFITAQGQTNVGIGTPLPETRLHITNASSPSFLDFNVLTLQSINTGSIGAACVNRL